MWLFNVSDITSYSEIQHPSPPRSQVQVGVHPPETVSGVWGSGVTSSTAEGLSIPDARGAEFIETEARYPGGQRAVYMMVNTVGRRQAGATWRSRNISGVKEALA